MDKSESFADKCWKWLSLGFENKKLIIGLWIAITSGFGAGSYTIYDQDDRLTMCENEAIIVEEVQPKSIPVTRSDTTMTNKIESIDRRLKDVEQWH